MAKSNMTIEESDFTLEYDVDHDVWNLYMIKVIHADDPELRREERTIFGWSMRLNSALKKIINHRIDKKQKVYTFKEYLKEYNLQLDKLNFITKQLGE